MKCVEADADGQDDVNERQRNRESQPIEVLCEEVEVLEEAEQQQVSSNGKRQPAAPGEGLCPDVMASAAKKLTRLEKSSRKQNRQFQ